MRTLIFEAAICNDTSLRYLLYSNKFKFVLERIAICLILAFIFFDVAHKYKLHSTNYHLNSLFETQTTVGPFPEGVSIPTAANYSGQVIANSTVGLFESSIVHKEESGLRTSFKQNSIFERYSDSAEERNLIHRLLSETLLRICLAFGFSWYFYSALYRDFYQQIAS